MQMQDYAKPYKPFRSQATKNAERVYPGDVAARLALIIGGTLWIGCVVIMMVVEFFNQFN